MNQRVERSRAALLDAGTRLLLANGPAAVTVDALVQSSGIARSTFYRQWPTRDEFIVELFHRLQPTIEPIDESLGFLGALHRMMCAAVEVMTDQEWRRLLPMIMLLGQGHPGLIELEQRHRAAYEQQVAELLALGEREGVVRSGLSARRVTQLLTGPVLLAALSGDIDDGLVEDIVEQFLAAEATLGHRSPA